jgi:exosome complex component RRP4
MEKKIVTPGELLFDFPKRLSGVYIENGKTYSSVVGMLSEGFFIPLKGRYAPFPGDLIVGVVMEERFSGYLIDVNAPFQGVLDSRDLRQEFKIGDVLIARVDSVDEINNLILVDPKKLFKGELLEVDAVTVPRIIGRSNSMIEMVRNLTKSEVFVGKNGRIFIKNGNVPLAIEAIRKISNEAHTSGLTDKIKNFLEASTNEQNK